MLIKFLNFTFRLLKKNILFSFINILGLSIGFAASLMIYLWVIDELSYDDFHKNSEYIYRVERDIYQEGQKMEIPITSPPTAPQISDDFAEVISFTRLAYDAVSIEDHLQNQVKERVFYADSSFFTIFSFKLIEGSPGTILKEPFTLTMSESAARKYLGPDPGVGETVILNYGGESKTYTLTGIFEDFPHNSHIQADLIASFGTLQSLKHPMMMNSWMASFHYSYILLEKKVDPTMLENQLQKMVSKYFGPEIRNFMDIQNPEEFMKLRLMPVTDIHLKSNREWETESPGSNTSILIFSIVAVLLLVIASANFINLSTARASRRATEVGIRKISGATRQTLVRQFLGESVFFGLLSLIFASLIIELSTPAFSELAGKDISIQLLLKGWNLPFVLLVWLMVVLLSGIYPAFVLSSYKPVKVLKASPVHNGGQKFRKVLVISQFVISTILIICTLTVYRHSQFINNKDLGYQRKNLVDIRVEDPSVFESFGSFREEIMKLPEVEGVSASMVIPTDKNYTDSPYLLRNATKTFFPVVNQIDENYLPVFEIKLLSGENFRRDMVNDSAIYYIINDVACKMFGFTHPADAIGKELGILTGKNMETSNWGKIVGVTRDFHFQSLTEEIKPMVMSSAENRYYHVTLRVNGSNKKESLEKIRVIWQQFYPDKLFTSKYISESFNSQHLTEKRLRVILIIFAILSILIACMGLFGLSVFSVEQRTKEIGLRKTMGAEIHQIIRLISLEFSRLVMIAVVIAIPVSYLIMREWLNNFPYRRGLEVWTFIIAITAVWLSGFLTIFFQTYRAGKMNPVRTLKYE